MPSPIPIVGNLSRITLAWAMFALAALPLPAQTEPRAAAQDALAEGNRLFREGRVEEAVTAYLAGYSPEAPHPTLLYNLGTALHHLDRLPEAILWYRRAASSDDPWLEENLWLARRSLGSQVLPPGGQLGWFRAHLDELRWLAVALAWIGLALLVFGTDPLRRLGLAAAIASLSLFLVAVALARWGPRSAVILLDCSTATAALPAGTEAWVTPASDRGWRISGTLDIVCPQDSVELI